MKNIVLLALILFWVKLGHSQNQKLPISVSYLGQLAYQPGLKIGSHFELKNWTTTAKQFTKLKSFYISPQIGFFTQPNAHTSYLINADFGYKRIKSHNQKYSAWSIGLAYMLQSQIIEWQVHLNDGSKEKIRANWNWFLPTLNYEFGQAIHTNLHWYGKFSYGIKMAPNRESTMLLFVELGIKFNLL
ncbi:MAG: hypothetical protein AAGD05_12620 [Bacteroidota bacterium]